MRDIKVTQVGTAWQLINPNKGELFLQGMEGVLSYIITTNLVAPAISEPGLSLEVLAYRTASGYVWVKAVSTGRTLSGLFESPGERVFFEGAYATMQQSFLVSNQSSFPTLVTSIAGVTEGDTTHPVAASAIFELLTAVGQQFQDINDDLSNKAPLESPVLTGTPETSEPDTNDNSSRIATTAFVQSVATTAQTNAESYADGLVVGLWDDRGTYDPTSGNWPASGGSGDGGAILKGDIWSISVAGTLTGGVNVNIGDVIRALVDSAGNTATDWGVTENNLGYVAENSANKATDLTSPDNTKYPTTQAVVTGLGTREPTLPASVGSTKFLREDRTWQSILDTILTGVSFASGAAVTAADSLLVAIGKLQAQVSAVNTTLFTSRGTGNTIAAGNDAVNCTSVNVQGTNNVMINCANFTSLAAQKEATFNNVRGTLATSLNTVLLPRGSTVRGTIRNAYVESFFQVTKLASNAPVLVQDSDGVKPVFTIGATSPTYFNVAVHEITVLSGLGPAMAVRRVMARQGYGVTVTTEGTDVDTGLVFNITENSDRLDIAITGAGGYASAQLTLQVMVRSFYGS